MILRKQEVVISKDAMGNGYHWRMEGIDFLRIAECECRVISWKVDGCPIAAGITHHSSVDPQVNVWRALPVPRLRELIGRVCGKANINIFMLMHQSGWGAVFRVQAVEAKVETVARVADKPMD